MHRHTGPHAFSPLLDRSLTIPPGPMATRATNVDRAATRPSFAPVTAFHKATQKPFRSTKGGRWGALHVSIAWMIYYHKQLKKIQQKPNSSPPGPTPEYLATGPLGPVEPEESARSSCRNPNIDSRYERTADRNEKGQTAEHSSHFSKSYLSDLYTSPSASHHAHLTNREKREKPPNLHWKEKLDGKERRGGHLVEKIKDLPPRGTSWAPSMTPELDDGAGGSRDRKRKREWDGSGTLKMVKQEAVDDRFDSSENLNTDPSPFGTTHTRRPSHARPDVDRGHLSAFYPDSSRWRMIRTPGGHAPYPGADMHPYQTASWGPIWDVPQRMDLHRGQNLQKDYSLNTCKAIRTLRPLYFPLAPRQQEPVYLGGREFLHSGHKNCHLHRAGYLATSYLEP